MSLSSFKISFYQGLARRPDAVMLFSLLFFSLLTRTILLSHPNSAVFDEVHFNYFASFYFTGEYYYDIHPPLAKLLIALSTLPFGGIPADDVVRTIGTPYPDTTYIAMRLVPSLLGSCLPPLIFLVGRELGLRLWPAFAAAALALFDNALVIQSRLILLDAMLLFFGLSSLWLFLRARRNDRAVLWTLSAVFAGFSLSIKWLGVAFLGLIGLVMLFDWIHQWLKRGWTPKPFLRGIAYLVVSLSVYVFVFLIHFTLLPNSHEQGDPFMSVAFQSTLKGNRYHDASGTIRTIRCPEGYRHQLAYGMPNTEVSAAEALACQIEYDAVSAPGFWGKLFELNRVMYATNQGLSAGHPDASKWYTWPLTHKPLYYWYFEGARIYLMANPVVWWLSALSVLALIIAQFRFTHWRQSGAFWIPMIGFWASLLPFTLVSRVMFMYHYLTSLCFAILILGFLLNSIRQAKWPAITLTGAAATAFLVLSPVTYGVNWYSSDLLWYLRFFGWHP